MGYTYGHKWSKEEISKQIHEVMNALNIYRMPSIAEMAMVKGNTTLENAIGHRGGIYKWAKELGLEIKRSETQTGKGFETVAISMLEQKGYKVQRMTTKYPFDLLINDNISIDVKVSKEYENKGALVHTVGINKKYSACDLYLIFLTDNNDFIQKTLIIPGNELKQTSLNMGKNSKYDKYIDRWDYIDKFNEFYLNLG